MVDDDPAQGVIDGRSFTHPDLRLQFIVPTGYLMQNGTRAVTIQGSGGQAQFSGGRFNGDLDDYICQVSTAADRRPGADRLGAAAADERQRHSRQLCHRPGQHLVRRRRRQRLGLSVGCRHHAITSSC